MTLPLSYWISTITGMISTSIKTLICVYMLKKYVFKTWKTIDYQLISIQVGFDVISGSSGILYFFTSIFTSQYSEIIPSEVSFLIGIFSSTSSELRISFAAIISVERTMATCAPITFYIYRKKFPNILIFTFILFYGVLIITVIFGFCGLRFPLLPGCTSFNCAIPQCSRNFQAILRIVFSSIIVCFSAMLCFKLSWLSIKKRTETVDLRKPT